MANIRWAATVAGLQAETGMANGEAAILAGYFSVGDGGGGTVWFSTLIATSRRITDASGTPIQITTQAPHGLTTGQRVMVAGVNGNRAANDTRLITSTGLKTFTLNGTISDGPYNGGGAIGDGGYTFPSDSATAGIWTRAIESEVNANAKWFGAKGDGQTDDLGAILAARDALNAAGGGVLFFPRGTFIVSNTIELGASTAVLGSGASSILQAKPDIACFNMLLVQNSDDVRVRDLVLDGNSAKTSDPDSDNENIGCGFLGLPVGEGQTGLSIRNVIVRNHHRSGIRITGPHNSDNPYELNANEVEVIGCEIRDCGSRGISLARTTQARIAGNVITCCTQAGIQLTLSRGAIIDGNVIQKTSQRELTHAGHGIAAANSFDYVIVNNVASDNQRWGIVASGGIGLWPKDGFTMSQRFVVANNVCRANVAGGITIDPTAPPEKDEPPEDEPPDGELEEVTQDSFATIASNVCVANGGPGIRISHAGYLAVRGNICDGNERAGIAIVSSRYTVVADNVLTANTNGVGFFAPGNVKDVGHYLLGGNVYDGNTNEIQIADSHPPIRQLHDTWPNGDAGGMNLPVKTTSGEPANPIDGVFYLNTEDRKLSVYAKGAWRTLQGTADTSW
jgi:parallel beta-helix repeat protein